MGNLKIVMLGAGNVAVHLADALVGANNQIVQVFSRTHKSASALANQFNAEVILDVRNIESNADLYVLSVSDNAIPEILQQGDFTNRNIVHIAGSVDLSIFSNQIVNHGVFYPLQTFSKNREVNFKEIPLCIEANNSEFESFLLVLAKELSNSVWQINSKQRRQLHLSAVFVCNFVNHLYSIGKELLVKENVGFEILHPLIKETANKVTEMDPQYAQTGPALRNDTESIKKHIELLSSCPEYQQIYKIISEDIYMKNR